MVPRRVGLLLLFCSYSTFFLERLIFPLILVTFSSFHGIRLLRPANLASFGDHEFRLLFKLFVCTQTHKYKHQRRCYFSHTVTVAALPYDGEQQQNPDDIIILHLSRPRETPHETRAKRVFFCCFFIRWLVDLRNSPPTQQAAKRHGNTHTHALTQAD